MTALVTSILVNGAALDLDDVLADVTLRVGRGGPDEPAQPAAASITLRGALAAFTYAFKVGDALVIAVAGAPRFTGRITDASLADDGSDDAGLMQVTAVGRRARLGRELVGAVDWPQEAFSARVARLFAELGASSSLVLDTVADDPLIVARVSLDAGGPVALDDALAELGDSVPLIAYERGDGNIVVQAISGRAGATPIDPSPGYWLYAPDWEQTDDVRNNISIVAPGLPLGGNAIDQSSIDRYGLRSETLTTFLAVQADALTRLYREITLRAVPIWIVGTARLTVPVPPAAIPYAIPDVGDPIVIRSLPASAPAPAGKTLRVVEGWQERITADNGVFERELALFLSPPAWSRVGVTWASLASSLKWNTVNPAYTWAENEGLIP